MSPGEEIICVVGAGVVGAGLAQAASDAGHRVLRCDPDPGSLCEAAAAHLVFEATGADTEFRQRLLGELEIVCRPEALFVSTTPPLSINELARRLTHPERLLGLSISGPAASAKLGEIVSGCATGRDAARTLGHTLSRWGRHCVQTRATPGLIVTRLSQTLGSEVLRLLEEGIAAPSVLDAVLRDGGGFRQGPLEQMDESGLDECYSESLSLFNAGFQDARHRPGILQKELVDAGHPVSRNGRGLFPHHRPARAPDLNPASGRGAPGRIVVRGGLGIASSLPALLGAAGIPVEVRDGSGVIEFEGAKLALTDGRSATERASAEEHDDLVLFDLAQDYTTSERIALAAADQCGQGPLDRAAALFRAIGKSVTAIEDVPGMIVMRTVCMLTNEGADLVNQGVCSVRDVDRAARFGAGFPLGPLVWADRIGLPQVLRTLDNLCRSYGEDRYRVSPLLRRNCHRGLDFYGGPAPGGGAGG